MPSRKQLTAFALIFVAYAVSLVIKRNSSFWLPAFAKQYSISTPGLFGTTWESANGISKNIGGVLVDLYPPSIILAATLGLQGASAAAVLLPFMLLHERSPGSAFALSSLLWGVNGFVQAFQWPALARIFLSWFPDPKQRGTWYGILATSQNVGAALAPYITARAVLAYGWTAQVYLPAALALVTAACLYTSLQDEPEAVGGRGTESSKKEDNGKPKTSLSLGTILQQLRSSSILAVGLMRRVLHNRTLWLLGLNYACNSFVRNAFTTFLVPFVEGEGGLAAGAGSAKVANSSFEMGGALGGLLAGILSDRLFNSRRGPVMLLSTLALALLPLYMALAPGAWSASSVSSLYFLLGLCAFPPHVLNGLVSREVAPSDAVSSAGGFTKSLGQLGAAAADASVQYLAASAVLSYPTAVLLGPSTVILTPGVDSAVSGTTAGQGGQGWKGVLLLLSLVSLLGAAIMVPLWSMSASSRPSGSSTSGESKQLGQVPASGMLVQAAGQTPGGGAQHRAKKASKTQFFTSPGPSIAHTLAHTPFVHHRPQEHQEQEGHRQGQGEGTGTGTGAVSPRYPSQRVEGSQHISDSPLEQEEAGRGTGRGRERRPSGVTVTPVTRSVTPSTQRSAGRASSRGRATPSTGKKAPGSGRAGSRRPSLR